MDSPTRNPSPAPGRLAALPWLLLLPGALLAWPGPGAPLVDDPYPHLAGAAWVGCGALPVAAFLLRARQRGGLRLRGLTLLLLLWIFILLRVWLGEGTDGYEARRVVALASTWPTLLVGGALLDAPGRRTYNRGLVLLSSVWTLTALLRSFSTDELGGVLGNSGPLSQAALPGAAIGAWYLATRRGLFWGLGLVACALFLAHAGLAPVLAGGVALSTALIVSAFVSPWARGRLQVRRWLGLMAALTVFVLIALRGAPGGAPPPADASGAPALEDAGAPADLGGVEVRARIWRGTLAMLGDHLLLGVGPGQFQAAFPPYRDPVEEELSRGGPCGYGNPEVDHAHDDPLQGLAELGLVGGSLWLLFLVLVALAALRALGGMEFSTIAMGAGALALLVNSLVHSPLTFDPASSAIAFPLFGALLARGERGLLLSRPVSAAALAVLAVGLLAGAPLVSQGLGLSRLVRANKAGHGEEALELARDLSEEHPDSASLRFLALQFDRSEAAWNAALEVRPHSVLALGGHGLARVMAYDPAGARVSWRRALELAPSSPTVLRNLVQLELRDGDRELALAYLARLVENGCDDAAWTARLGSELVLAGRWEDGALLLTGRPLGELVPELLFAEEDPARRGAAKVLAHLLWGRDQVLRGELDDAVRSFRQVVAPTRAQTPGGAQAARAELVAALVLAGRDAEVLAESDGLGLDARVRAGLPEWARAALAGAGLLGEQ